MADRDSKGRLIKGHKSLHTPESREKLREIAKKRGFGMWNKGRKLSEETKRKVKENSARYWLGKKRPEMIGNKFAKGSQPNQTSFKKGHVPSTLGKFGKDHPKWKVNKRNPLRQAIRQLSQYRQWRSDVFKRDNHTCVFCKRKKEVSGKLEADHYPKSFAMIIVDFTTVEEAVSCRELWDINNGRTLCKECHSQTDNFFWKARMK